MARGGTVGAGGGFGTGLLLLVGGLILKHSQANMVSECSSGFGPLGQAFDPNVASKCGMAQELNSAGRLGDLGWRDHARLFTGRPHPPDH